jgi:hypothetical protein
MKRSLRTVSLVLASLLMSVSGLAAAQGLTREQVKMDRDAFLKTMRWDELTGQWVLKSGMEPPAGVLSRAEVIAMRDKFLTMHSYNEAEGWVPLKAPRDMSKLSREQVNMETLRFLMMYRFEELTGQWVSKALPSR